MTSASTKRPAVEQDGFRRIVRALRTGDEKDAEIRRLRAAMVHAMDDAHWGAMVCSAGTQHQRRFSSIERRLKTALEKK
jgi:diphthamide synthase subunit DPH2